MSATPSRIDGLVPRRWPSTPRSGVLISIARHWSPVSSTSLAPQDFLYTVVERDREGIRLRIVGALIGTLVAPEAPEDLVALMAQPTVKIVSLTVTEKGYRHDPATGTLDEDQPDVRYDAAPRGCSPRTTPGFLVAALARRRAEGLPPFTVLSCDSLPSNGETTRRVVARMAELRDPDLPRFIRAMMDEEVTPTLDLPGDVDLGAYKNQLMGAICQPGAPAPHGADRDGWIAETPPAAAPADPGPHRHRSANAETGSGGRCVDAAYGRNGLAP